MNPTRDGVIARTFSLVIAALCAGVLWWMLNNFVVLEGLVMEEKKS